MEYQLWLDLTYMTENSLSVTKIDLGHLNGRCHPSTFVKLSGP